MSATIEYAFIAVCAECKWSEFADFWSDADEMVYEHDNLYHSEEMN